MKQRAADSKAAVEDIPVVLESAINGSTTKKKNPHAPETVQEHIDEMIRVLDAGATIVHNHSNQFHEDPEQTAQFYAEVFRPIRERYPHSILYATLSMDVRTLHGERRAMAPGAVCAHHRVLAEAVLANMLLFDTGVTGISVLGEDGIPDDEKFFIYQLWPPINNGNDIFHIMTGH